MEDLQSWWTTIQEDFYRCFIQDDRWKYLIEGLGNTLKLTFFAVLIGIAIGAVVAMVRSTYDKQSKEMQNGFAKWILCILNVVAKIYLTVIRGTPVIVQLLIMNLVILVSTDNKILVGTLAFGINSGAYVAEIIRSGIMSVDSGQFEAGRSLGFNYMQTMWYVVIPQALKSVLPALANEFIVLLKETSVAGYIALMDLTRATDILKGITYNAYMPLFAVALIYLVMVMFFTFLVNKLERRLRNSER